MTFSTSRTGKNDARLVVPYITVDDEEGYVSTGETQTFIRQIIQVFAKSIDVKDKYSNRHSARVAGHTKRSLKSRIQPGRCGADL